MLTYIANDNYLSLAMQTMQCETNDIARHCQSANNLSVSPQTLYSMLSHKIEISLLQPIYKHSYSYIYLARYLFVYGITTRRGPQEYSMIPIDQQKLTHNYYFRHFGNQTFGKILSANSWCELFCQNFLPPKFCIILYLFNWNISSNSLKSVILVMAKSNK